MPPHLDDLLPALRALAPEEGRPLAGESVLVALSGGVDSVALLDLLLRLELRCEAFHLDHQLRPESPDEAAFCAALCAERGIPLHLRRAPITEIAAARGIGIEAAGREERYRIAEELRRARDLDRIATAHQLDDHVETLVMWLFRGCGLDGMRGINPRQGRLLRPLRSFRRARIEAYARWRELSWREDASNRDPRFLRNRVRHELLPRVEEIFGPAAPERLAAFARRATADAGLLEGLATDLAADLALPEGGFDRELYRRLDPRLQRALMRRFLADRARSGGSQRYGEQDWERLAGFAAEAASGRRSPLPGGGWLHIGNDRFEFVFESTPAGRPGLLAESLPPSEAVLTFSGQEAYFDADRLRLPLRLRSLQPGDRMQLAGRSGRKRLVDLLREDGVPSWRRGAALVVEDAETIIWAVGHAVDADRRPTGHTQRVLRLQVVSRPG